MPGKHYYECIVCGRKFPQGQGIIIRKAGYELAFHSSRCAARFLKLLLERADDRCLSTAIKETIDELRKALEARRERTKKVI